MPNIISKQNKSVLDNKPNKHNQRAHHHATTKINEAVQQMENAAQDQTRRFYF